AQHRQIFDFTGQKSKEKEVFILNNLIKYGNKGYGFDLGRENSVEFVKSKKKQSLDRKSTRLNSSHVKISYAVFCLKKKNTEKDYQPLERKYARGTYIYKTAVDDTGLGIFSKQQRLKWCSTENKDKS